MASDLETRAGDDGDLISPLNLWLRLSVCTNLVQNELRSRLRAAYDTTLPRFDLLTQLYSSPKGLKMGELSRRLMVSNGNITAIANQLHKEGLIEKIIDESDRRSTFLKLTPKGLELFSKMNQSYEAWIHELFGKLKPRGRYRSFHSLEEVESALSHSINLPGSEKPKCKNGTQ